MWRNLQDAVVRGRTARGERNGTAVISDRRVERLRIVWRKTGLSFAELAEDFGMSDRTVRQILIGIRR